MLHTDNYSHHPWVQNWVFVMILSVNVFTFAIKTLIKECILIVWLFQMKIGWFEISMIRNGTTPTFWTKCLNIMMFIMFGWNIVSHSNSWNVIVFCMKGNVKFCLMLSPRNWLNNIFFFFRCGYPCPHVLKVTNKLTIEMIKVQHCRRPIGPTYDVGPWTHEYRKKKRRRFLITEKLWDLVV